MNTVANNPFLVKEFHVSEQSIPTISLLEFCKMNNMLPASDVVLTKENSYKGVHFRSTKNTNETLFLMFGTKSAPKVEVGDVVSTKWSVAWIEDKQYFRLMLPVSTVSIVASEWE